MGAGGTAPAAGALGLEALTVGFDGVKAVRPGARRALPTGCREAGLDTGEGGGASFTAEPCGVAENSAAGEKATLL